MTEDSKAHFAFKPMIRGMVISKSAELDPIRFDRIRSDPTGDGWGRMGTNGDDYEFCKPFQFSSVFRFQEAQS